MAHRVLVLDSESAAGVECIQSLGRHGEHVYAASRAAQALGFHSRYLLAKLKQPASADQFPIWLEMLDQHYHFHLIIPPTEVSLSSCNDAKIAPALRAKAVLSSRASITQALDKESVWNLASSLGIPVPRSLLLTKDAAAKPPFAFPLVVKPTHSKRITGAQIHEFPVTIVRDQAQWRDLLSASANEAFQVQEYVRGRGVGIELLFENGEPRWHFAHQRIHEYPLTGGGSSYRVSIHPDPRLLRDSERLLRRLQWHGVAMVEWKMNDAGQWFLIEINPRLWGSLALAIDAGVDFPLGLLQLATGEPLPPQPHFRVPFYTRNLSRDLTWQMANLRADHTDPLLFTKPCLRSLLEPLRLLLGRESWDHFDRHDLRVTSSIIAQAFGLRVRAALLKLWRTLHSFLIRKWIQPHVLSRVQRRGIRKLMFVCYGNICRSPLAEQAAQALLPNLQITSAGFHSIQGRGSPRNMLNAAGTLGFDLSAHRSSILTEQSMRASDLIVIMDWRNYDLLRARFPHALRKAIFLGLFSDPPRLEIADPYDMPLRQTAEVAAQIQQAIARLTLCIGEKKVPVNAAGAIYDRGRHASEE